MERQRYKVIIAEDDIHQMSLLKKFTSEMELDIVSAVSSGLRLVEEVKNFKPDIILLDISLQKLDGISAIKEIHAAGIFYPQIIFVTGSTKVEHLLAGFEYGSVDYITKPVNENRFKNAITKAKEKIHSKKLLDAEVDVSINWIYLKENYREIPIAENQIVFVEKERMHRSYTVHLKDGSTVETTTQLNEIYEMGSENLVYSHRGYLVNILYITSIQPVSQSYKNYEITMEHTSIKVPLTKKNYESINAFSKFRSNGDDD